VKFKEPQPDSCYKLANEIITWLSVGGAFIGQLIDNQAGVNIASNWFKVVKTQFKA